MNKNKKEPKNGGFTEEPLKEKVWLLKIGFDDYLAQANAKVDNQVFLNYLKFCLKRNEVISLTIRGRVRCLAGSQLVIARFGDVITRILAKDFSRYKNQAELLTYNFKKKVFEWQKYYDTVYYYRGNNIKVETISGREIICDANHEFPVYQGRDITHGFKFKNILAKDLTERDCLLMTTNVIESKNLKFYDDYDLGFLVGVFLADGYISDKAFTLTNNDVNIKNKSKYIIDKYFINKCNWRTELRENSSSLSVQNKLLVKFLGGRGTNAGNKCLIDEDLISSEDYKNGLLDGYFSCECEISKKTGYISVTSKSQRLIEDIGFMLLQRGYITTRTKKIIRSGDYKGNKYFKLTISASQTYKFRNEIMRTRSNLMNIYKFNENAELQRRVIDGFLLDRIKKVTKIKSSSVFCVNIKNGNFLLANGILSNNSGKSLSSFCIAMIVSEFTGIPFIPEKHIKFSWEDYMNELQKEDVSMHSIYVIDEKEDSVGSGSYAETIAQTNVQRICAKKCIHTISLVGDYSIMNINSSYNLVTRERNFDTFETRLILYNVENNEEIPICSVVIPIKKVLCNTILTKEKNSKGVVVSGCVMCDKYKDDKLCSAETFLKRYEKAKDKNIERILHGGSSSSRQKSREDMAFKLLDDKRYLSAHSRVEQKAMANSILPKLSNRPYTIDEVDEIVTLSRIFKREVEERMPVRSLDAPEKSQSTLSSFASKDVKYIKPPKQEKRK